jgi:hypothetical protein
MGRPRASEKNLAIAFSIADVLTKRCRNGKCANAIACRGENSVFAVISTCVPELLRSSDENGIKNRNGITESETNKYLLKCGYSKYRDRRRVKGTSDKWDEGCPKWKDRQWMNPHDEDDIIELRSRLRECLIYFPNLDLDIVSEAVITKLKTIVSELSNETTGREPSRDSHNLALCRHIPRMRITAHHRSVLGEIPRYRWPAGLERVPLSFGPVFHAFYQVLRPRVHPRCPRNHTNFLPPPRSWRAFPMSRRRPPRATLLILDSTNEPSPPSDLPPPRFWLASLTPRDESPSPH